MTQGGYFRTATRYVWFWSGPLEVYRVDWEPAATSRKCMAGVPAWGVLEVPGGVLGTIYT